MRATFIASWIALASCGDFASPSALDHAQILAVRASPPRLAPGQRAQIEVLAALDDGSVSTVGMPEVIAPPLSVGADPIPVRIEVSVELEGQLKRAERWCTSGHRARIRRSGRSRSTAP
jgi:hypothetical protein